MGKNTYVFRCDNNLCNYTSEKVSSMFLMKDGRITDIAIDNKLKTIVQIGEKEFEIEKSNHEEFSKRYTVINSFKAKTKTINNWDEIDKEMFDKKNPDTDKISALIKEQDDSEVTNYIICPKCGQQKFTWDLISSLDID